MYLVAAGDGHGKHQWSLPRIRLQRFVPHVPTAQRVSFLGLWGVLAALSSAGRMIANEADWTACPDAAIFPTSILGATTKFRRFRRTIFECQV